MTARTRPMQPQVRQNPGMQWEGKQEVNPYLKLSGYLLEEAELALFNGVALGR